MRHGVLRGADNARILASILPVASSITKMLDGVKSARARLTRARSPTERLDPPSCTRASSLPSIEDTFSLRFESSKTVQSSVSSCTLLGSKLSLTVPSNSDASCGIIASRCRKSLRPMVEVLTESTLILPLAGSMIRNSARVKELFPAPVLPTIPIFSRGLMSRLISFKIKSSSGRYRAE